MSVLLKLSAVPNVGDGSMRNVGSNSTGLVSYADMLRALGLSRYVGDRLRREGRFRTVESGKNFFVPAADVERLRVYLSEQDEAREAPDAVAELPWFCRSHKFRLPIPLSRTNATRALCGAHLYQRIAERVGENVCEITWVASLGLRIRFARSAEICADCTHEFPIRDCSPHILGCVDVADFTGDRSRGVCVAHFCDALVQGANEIVPGCDGRFIATSTLFEIFQRLHVGNGYEFCSVCMTAAGEQPIRKRTSSPVHQYDFILRHPKRAASRTLQALP